MFQSREHVISRMGKKIKVSLINDIVSHLNQGKSSRTVASQFKVSKTTVQRIAKAKNIKLDSKRGAKKKLNEREVKNCAKKIISGESKSVTELTKQLKEQQGIIIDRRTVARALNTRGLKAGEKKKKPGLSQKNIKARLEWAKIHKDWTVEDWNRVIFSDESKINRFNSDGRSWCWFREVEQLEERTVKVTFKHGGGGLMVWGCMNSKGVGYLCKIEGTMDQHLYKSILQDDLLETIKFYNLKQSEVIFQHDNDPKHKSKIVQNWLSEQEFAVLPWPAQSPDLNPIEHLWSEVKRQLNKFNSPPKGINDLWERIVEVWNKISIQSCQNLIASMPRRINDVIKAKGRWTKY
jgi:transposase